MSPSVLAEITVTTAYGSVTSCAGLLSPLHGLFTTEVNGRSLLGR